MKTTTATTITYLVKIGNEKFTHVTNICDSSKTEGQLFDEIWKAIDNGETTLEVAYTRGYSFMTFETISSK
ncbi:MAG: hypothetical protein IH795_05615 [Bacteroidetes bacterium]|nr:hypothetical protein [Bacteroidota bacterium]